MNAGYAMIVGAAIRALHEVKAADHSVKHDFRVSVKELELVKEHKYQTVAFEVFERAFQSCMYTSGRGETI